MLRAELEELLRNGESSGIELKRDAVHPQSLAKEMAALLNLEGGYIPLGVEDDAAVTGLARNLKKAEEWVMEVSRQHLQPPVIPYWETVAWDETKRIGVIALPADSPDKPYKASRAAPGSPWCVSARPPGRHHGRRKRGSTSRRE